MYKQLLITLIATCAHLLLLSCQKDDAAEKPPLTPEEIQASNQAQLQGSWQSECRESEYLAFASKANLGITQRSEVRFDKAQMTEVSTISSMSCDSRDIEIVTTGSYKTEIESTDEIKSLQLTLTQVAVKPLSEFGRRVLTIAKWCGVDTWAIDQEVDVTAQYGKEKCFENAAKTTFYRAENNKLLLEPDAQTNSQPKNGATVKTKLNPTLTFTRH